MLPLAVLLGVVLAAPPALTALAIATGAAAALVQALGLVRWPYAVPELARRYVAAPDGEPARPPGGRSRSRSPRSTVARRGHRRAPRYLLTGAWTLLVAASILATPVLPAWLGIVGIPIGVALLVGTLEFVGPNERDGWPLAGTIVPIAYIAWSLWLILLGRAAARVTGGARASHPGFPSVPGDDGARGRARLCGALRAWRGVV